MTNWCFPSYAALKAHLEQELASTSKHTSRTRDLDLLLGKIIPAAQRWNIPLDWINKAGLSKLRVIIPKAGKALQEGNGSAFSELLELASRLSWRELRRQLDTLRRARISVRIKTDPRQEGSQYMMVSFRISRALWETLQQLTRDHVIWDTKEVDR